jgi:hypothetical protein
MSPAEAAFVASFGRVTLRSASADDVCPADVLAAARDGAGRARFEAFNLAHQGRYERSEAPIAEPVAEALARIASAASGRPVAVRRHRWMRLRAGDYSLRADDAAWLEHAGIPADPLDMTLDLSLVSTGEADVVFTHEGTAFFTVPQGPGQIGLAERTPSVERYDRYLTHRVGDRVVVRLRLLLA